MSVLSRIGRLTEQQRGAVQLAADLLAWALAVLVGLAARYDFRMPPHGEGAALGVCILVAWVGQIAVGRATLLYRGRYRFGSFEEVAGLAITVASTTCAVTAVDLAISAGGHYKRVPVSVPFVAGIGALVLMFATRYLWRDYLERRQRALAAGEPLIVFGAGEAGSRVIRAMLHDPAATYIPIALLDDDPAKQRLRVLGIPVRGNRHAIPAVASATGAKTLLIAIPSADAALLRGVTELAEHAGLHVKVLPPVSELIRPPGVSDIRDIDLVDLLGRRQVETDVDSIAGYLTGRRVLITGAGGSIGSELCRQIYRYRPAELMMLDRDESALHAVQLSIYGRALLDSDELVLADIRDRNQIREIFATRRPEVVFHAAALKHLTLLERHPGEAVKTNVWGTRNVLEAAYNAGVTHFVNISTDKAANPESVLGYSKLVSERLTAGVAERSDERRFLSVRFGNVLGSRGSVLTAFAAQVAAGGPITVTHPDVTRFFMTVQEAVQLVIQAGAIGDAGETLVLDMGEPVRIRDVAQRLAEQAPRKIDIVFTGLRPGEKLHEDLLSSSETDNRTRHPLISHVPGAPVDESLLDGLDPSSEPEEVRQALASRALAEFGHARENSPSDRMGTRR
ncbi:MAG TPA: nucleoside-diphosphate sugar epimerase/dehydratase [Mycobacteriales bacterium]|nr:nucleoside-diphosphate sugar epimerase/dehydratase [Mycobacteriales bacterium]HVW81499.1 nucleoside-diphosphate sugar epimerase/dehydratase [Mycobacteriales bacterium]